MKLTILQACDLPTLQAGPQKGGRHEVAGIDLLFLFFFCGLLLTQFGASLPLISHWVQFPTPEEAEQMGTITVVINYFLRLYILCAVVDVLTQLAYTFLLYGHFLARRYGAKPEPDMRVRGRGR